MSNLSTLKQQVEEMQAEIERMEAEEREPEIPVGTLCWFWDTNQAAEFMSAFSGVGNDPSYPFESTSGDSWTHARIANDIHGTMVWQKHDGGPCPVDERTELLAIEQDCANRRCRAGSLNWRYITAYAIINKAEWMD